MRILAATAAVVFLIIIAWLAGRAFNPRTPKPRTTATATPASTPTAPGPQATNTPLRHRLAGTVVGDARYAVIEDLSGGNELYRPGQTVPGLGLLIEVGPRNAVFEADGRRFELALSAAPTATPEPTVEATPEPDEEADEEADDLTEPAADRSPARESDSSGSESSSSDEPDRPAS